MITFRRSVIAALVLGASLGGCSCGDDEIIKVPHQLDVTPNPVEFGEVGLAQSKTVQISLANPSIVAVEIVRCERSDDTEPVFTIGECPTLIPSGQTRLIDVTIAPVVEDNAEGVLILETLDATSGPSRCHCEASGSTSDAGNYGDTRGAQLDRPPSATACYLLPSAICERPLRRRRARGVSRR